MPFVPTPLRAAVEHLLASIERISALAPPAFGLPAEAAAEAAAGAVTISHDDSSGNYTGAENGESSGRIGRGEKRVARLRFRLRYVHAVLVQLRDTLYQEPGRWEEITRERKELIETRALVMVLGAGTVALNGLEEALEELARLYETEECVKKCKGKGAEMERDVNVVRWMRHERRGKVWEVADGGLRKIGAAVRSMWRILEDCFGDPTTNLANLRATVAEILAKDDELSTFITAAYPDASSTLARQETDAVSTVDGSSSVGQDTPRSSIGTLVCPPENHSDIPGVICDADEYEDSDSDDGIPTPTSSEFPFPDSSPEDPQITLASMQSLDSILIPVTTSTDQADTEASGPSNAAGEPDEPDSDTDEPFSPHRNSRNSDTLKVIAVSPAGVDIAPLRLPENTRSSGALSADAVFNLPEVTDQVVLDFFRRALRVSRFASRFRDGSSSIQNQASPSQQLKVQELLPRQLRELCTDLYDELVRRNVDDQNRTRRGSQVRSAELDGFDIKRVYARGRLAGLGDDAFGGFVAVVLGELERRLQGSVVSQTRECEAAVAP